MHTDYTLNSPRVTCFRPSPVSAFAHFSGAFNALTDLVLTVVPAMLIFRLRTTARAKWAATLLLGLSSVYVKSFSLRRLEKCAS